MSRLQSFQDNSKLRKRMNAPILILLSFILVAFGFVQCSTDPPSSLELIRNKFDNLTKLAGGALVGESIRNGNIIFARVVTYLMIADQFPPQSNWVDILTKYRGEDSELDELAEEIEIFEDFVENNTISFPFDDIVASKLVEFVENCKIIRRMAEQAEHFEGVIEKIESLDLKRSVGSSAYSEFVVTRLAILPHVMQSLSRLNANSSSKIDNVERAYEMFQKLEDEGRIRKLAESIHFFDTTPPFANRTFEQQLLATDHAKVIENTFNITELLSLDEEFIRDCGNFLWIFDNPESLLDSIETLVENIEHFEDVRNLINIMLEVDYSGVVKPKIQNETERFLLDLSYFEKFRDISKLLEVSRSSVKIISLAEKIAKNEVVEALTSDDTNGHFLVNTKLLQMFNGSKAFIDSANFSKSQFHNVPSINGMANIDLQTAFEIFHKYGKQLQIIESWLGKLEFGDVVHDAIRRFGSVKNKITKNITPSANYEHLVSNMKSFSSIREVRDGYQHFLEILKWLKSNPNLISKVRENLAYVYVSQGESQGLLLMDIALTVRFLKKLLVVDKPVYHLNLSDFDVVNELRKHLDHYSKNYKEYEEDGVVDNARKVIEKILKKNTSWEKGAAEGNWTDNYESIILSQQAMDRFSKLNLDETRKFLDDVKYQMEELNFMWKAGEAMENIDAGKFAEGLASMAEYVGNRNVSIANSTCGNCEKLKEYLLPDILANLTASLQIYYDLVEGINSAEHLKYIAEQAINNDNVPNDVKYYIGNFRIWLSGASVLEVLSKEEIDMKPQRLFRNMPNIRMSLSQLIRWIEKVPKSDDKEQVEQMKKSLAESEKENEFVALLNFTEKAQDPKYTKAIRIIFENLEKLAKIFGYIDHSILCQADSFGPYGSMCSIDKSNYCPVPLQGEISHWSSQYISMIELFCVFFIQIIFGLYVLLKIYQYRNPKAAPAVSKVPAEPEVWAEPVVTAVPEVSVDSAIQAVPMIPAVSAIPAAPAIPAAVLMNGVDGGGVPKAK